MISLGFFLSSSFSSLVPLVLAKSSSQDNLSNFLRVTYRSGFGRKKMVLQRAKTLLAQVLAGHQLTKLGGRAVSCRPVSTRFSLLLFQPSGFAWPEITTAQR
jgi:hypothetical protein